MLYLVILILLTALLFIWIKAILYRSLASRYGNYRNLQAQYDKLFAENAIVKRENSNLQEGFEQIITLYDITKQICKSLEADKVFAYFKEEMAKHIAVSDCQFLKSDTDLSEYHGYSVIPLEIEKSRIGYLAASGISQKDRRSFQILAQQFLLGMKRAFLYQRIQELAITDGLTQVFSRRYFLERFREELVRSEKFNYSFSCLMIDIDHFKDYNDRYGHLVGDAILREVSKTIKENIRQIDLMGRYGGEEFSLILTETDKEKAELAAERIRQAIENKRIRVYNEDLKATVSIGISTFPIDAKDMEQLIDKADLALYQAKEAGRNKVCVYG